MDRHRRGQRFIFFLASQKKKQKNRKVTIWSGYTYTAAGGGDGGWVIVHALECTPPPQPPPWRERTRTRGTSGPLPPIVSMPPPGSIRLRLAYTTHQRERETDNESDGKIAANVLRCWALLHLFVCVSTLFFRFFLFLSSLFTSLERERERKGKK